MQRVAAGSYRTTEAAHLRDEARNILANIPAGSSAIVHPPERTSRFSLGLLSRSKDHTWVSCQGRDGWMRDEVLEAAMEPPAPQEVARGQQARRTLPLASAPVTSPGRVVPRTPATAIPITGAPSRVAAADESAEDVSGTSLTPLHGDFPAINAVEVSAGKAHAFRRFSVYVHFTKPAYRTGIHAEGLRPGRRQGIGLPTDSGARGSPDAHHVYVLSGSAGPPTRMAVMGESGGAPVAVVSRNAAPDRDVNYERGAYRFHGAIPPGRQSGGDRRGTISLVLPLTPSGRRGLADFLNDGVPEDDLISPDEAQVLLGRELFRQYPLMFRRYQGL